MEFHGICSFVRKSHLFFCKHAIYADPIWRIMCYSEDCHFRNMPYSMLISSQYDTVVKHVCSIEFFLSSL